MSSIRLFLSLLACFRLSAQAPPLAIQFANDCVRATTRSGIGLKRDFAGHAGSIENGQPPNCQCLPMTNKRGLPF